MKVDVPSTPMMTNSWFDPSKNLGDDAASPLGSLLDDALETSISLFTSLFVAAGSVIIYRLVNSCVKEIPQNLTSAPCCITITKNHDTLVKRLGQPV